QDLDRVDTHLGPKTLVATQHGGVVGGTAGVGRLLNLIGASGVGLLAGRFFRDLLLGRFGRQLVGGPGRLLLVDVRRGDDVVDRAEHVVPVVRDDLGDRVPAFAAG